MHLVVRGCQCVVWNSDGHILIIITIMTVTRRRSHFYIITDYYYYCSLYTWCSVVGTYTSAGVCTVQQVFFELVLTRNRG